LSGHFDGSCFFVSPKHDFNRIAGLFARLLAYGFQRTQYVLWITVPDGGEILTT